MDEVVVVSCDTEKKKIFLKLYEHPTLRTAATDRVVLQAKNAQDVKMSQM